MCHRLPLPEPCDIVHTRLVSVLAWLDSERARMTRNARKKELRAGAPRRTLGPRDRWYDGSFRLLHAQGWPVDALAAQFGLTSAGSRYAHTRLGLTPNRKRILVDRTNDLTYRHR